MKKTLAFILMLTAIISMIALPGSAAAVKPYAEAAVGDLLWQVDFNAKDVFDPQPNDKALASFEYTITGDGKGITVKGKEDGVDKKVCFWGGEIKGLEVDSKSQVTMTFKIRANGQKGENSSSGIGGWMYNSTDTTKYNSQYLHNYGNWNAVGKDGSELQNRASLSLGQTRKANKGGYLYVVDQAVADADGFITCKIEYNAPENVLNAYYLGAEGKWLFDEENVWTMEKLDDQPDSLCFMIYSYFLDCDHTIKDIKYYKGIGLTDAQLNATAVPETTKALETAKAPVTTKAPEATPATADATAYIAAICVAAALIAGTLLKKKED